MSKPRRRSDAWVVRACLASAIVACLLATLNIVALGRFFRFIQDSQDMLDSTKSLRSHFGTGHLPILYAANDCGPRSVQDTDPITFLLTAFTWGAPAAFIVLAGLLMASKRGLLAVAALALLATTASAESVAGWLHPEIIDRLERFIMTVGFSVFTALWFMFRAEKRLDDNNKLQAEQIALLKKLLGEKE
jgi:hypothetical protein